MKVQLAFVALAGGSRTVRVVGARENFDNLCAFHERVFRNSGLQSVIRGFRPAIRFTPGGLGCAAFS